MEKRQEEHHALVSEIDVSVTKIIQEEMRSIASTEKEVNDLTRLRIERNKAAKHARCSTMLTK